jgi:hypothetical protein
MHAGIAWPCTISPAKMLHRKTPNSSCSRLIDKTLLDLILMNNSRMQSIFCLDCCKMEKVNKNKIMLVKTNVILYAYLRKKHRPIAKAELDSCVLLFLY